MTKRLAVTISGAVSLGSYEAGVMYEIFEAIGQHNADPKTTPDNRIEIDVITGASAGAMTAAIAAQKLLYEGKSLGDPDSNPFYHPWVTDVNMTGLLNVQADANPTHSILSSNFVAGIAKNYITKRYASHIPLTAMDRIKHPAAAAKIYLGLALSNLNGVNYSQSLRTGGKFTYTEHQDQLSIDFLADGSDGRDSADIWEVVRTAAVASGAFPFAFQVQDLTRHQSEYPGADPFPLSSPTEVFTYTDGGAFQNEPLGMAKNFVDMIDNHQNSDTRFYLFVSPGARDGKQNLSFHAHDADLWTTAQRLGLSVLDQAGFQDWIVAENVNEKVRLFNQRADGLKDAFLKTPGTDGYANHAQVGNAARQLLPLLFSSQPAGSQGVAWTRLKQQFSDEYAILEASPLGTPGANDWIDAILTFETAANLASKDEMNIYGITSAPSDLASGDLSAFAGFFDERYRQHDYDVGRAHARAFLTSPAIGGIGQIGTINYATPKPLRDIDHSLDGLTVDKMDKQTREAFRDRILNRAYAFMDEIGVPTSMVRGAIDDFIIKPQLNKLLKL